MLHQEIAGFTRMAERSLGAFGYHDTEFTWKQNMRMLLGHNGAERVFEGKERELAKEGQRLEYDYDNMVPMTAQLHRDEAKHTLEVIAERQSHLELYYCTGKTFWEFKGEKHDIKSANIYRLQAPDGYQFDYEPDEYTTEDGEIMPIAHVKFILQRDHAKQGNGVRLGRHVKECVDVLFETGMMFVWGKVSPDNQFSVKETNNGKNWREKLTRIRDAHGKLSNKISRLEAIYLKQGWIHFGQNQEREQLIAYLSPKGIKYVVEKHGKEILEEFKYSKKYEKIISNYKV